MLFDTSLLAARHFFVFLVIFTSLAALFAYAARQKIRYIGLPLAVVTALGAWMYLPAGAARVSFFVATGLIILVGWADEQKPISAWQQFLWQLLIVSVLVISGWTIPYVSNPLGGGVLHLGWLAGVASVAWLLLIINAVNWLDGADGLAGGVVLVGQLALAAAAMLPSVYSEPSLGMALVGVAGLLAFFIWNFPPAKVYLGTIGSWFVGMYVAIAAIRGGGKIATTLLILALPVFDVAVVAFRRMLAHQPIWQGDTVSHIHHRLARAGIGPRQLVLGAIAVTTCLAIASIILPTAAKLLMLVGICASVTSIALRLGIRHRMLKRSYEKMETLSSR